jgi:ribosomal protein S18 acetylase RimI-like enzyme
MFMAEPMTNLRKAGPADVAAISMLTDAAYSGYIPLIGRKPQPMLADYARMVVDNTIYVLTIGECLAGVLVLVNEPDSLLIYSVAIHPDYQGQGFGRQLLALAEQQAIEAGYSSIRLYTNEHFTYNIELYQWLGYQETGREPLLGSNLVHMRKQLIT